jgi:hypothetical protein
MIQNIDNKQNTEMHLGGKLSVGAVSNVIYLHRAWDAH